MHWYIIFLIGISNMGNFLFKGRKMFKGLIISYIITWWHSISSLFLMTSNLLKNISICKCQFKIRSNHYYKIILFSRLKRSSTRVFVKAIIPYMKVWSKPHEFLKNIMCISGIISCSMGLENPWLGMTIKLSKWSLLVSLPSSLKIMWKTPNNLFILGWMESGHLWSHPSSSTS